MCTRFLTLAPFSPLAPGKPGKPCEPCHQSKGYVEGLEINKKKKKSYAARGERDHDDSFGGFSRF